jgi:hypothetical protein
MRIVQNSILAERVILSESVVGSLADMLDFKHRDVLTSIQRGPSHFVDRRSLGWFGGLKKFLSSVFFPAKDDPNSKRMSSYFCNDSDLTRRRRYSFNFVLYA